jgi:hypothetical protein
VVKRGGGCSCLDTTKSQMQNTFDNVRVRIESDEEISETQVLRRLKRYCK